MEKEIEFEIKIKIDSDIEIEESHTMTIGCAAGCLLDTMVENALNQFYREAKAKLLKQLKAMR